MKTALLVIGLGAGLVLTACASPTAQQTDATVPATVAESPAPEPAASSASATATPVEEPVQAPEATVVAMSVEQAGEYYLDWICWSNSASAQWTKLMKKTSGADYTSKRIRDRAAEEASIHRAVAVALENPPAPWPASVAKDVLKVAGGQLDEVSAYGYWSRSDTLSEVSMAIADLQKAGGTQAAQRVRLRLGLPAAGGKKDGCWIRRNADGVVPPPAGAPLLP